MSAAYVPDSVRTPFGRFGGALAGVPPTTSPPTRSGRCWRCSTRRALALADIKVENEYEFIPQPRSPPRTSDVETLPR